MPDPSRLNTISRRRLLQNSLGGLGTIALASLLQQDRVSAAPSDPLQAKLPHLPGSHAKSVIFLFMAGGPSHEQLHDSLRLREVMWRGLRRRLRFRFRHSILV